MTAIQTEQFRNVDNGTPGEGGGGGGGGGTPISPYEKVGDVRCAA